MEEECLHLDSAGDGGAATIKDFFCSVKNPEAAGDCLFFGTSKSWAPQSSAPIFTMREGWLLEIA
jgi:hypothetical protein